MDAQGLIDTFALAHGTAVNKTRVPKARFLELPNVNAQKRKLLSDEVDSVTLLAVFNEDTTNIPPLKTAEVVYEEVYFFQVALKKDTHLAELNQLLQTHITNPAVIFYTLDNLVTISVSPKRLHKQEVGKTVSDAVFLTPWLDITNVREYDFLVEGKVTNCSFTHLERFYQDFTNYVRHAEMLRLSETLTVDRRRDWSVLEPLLKQLRATNSEMRRLSEEERKQAGFGDKLSLRSKQVKLEKERLQTTENIKKILENKA